MANEINRKSIALPTDVSAEIIAKTQEDSAIMQLARKVTLPGRGVTIPVITGDPEASWVGETEKAKVSNSTLSTKQMTAYKLVVVETFSKEFTRDASALYDELKKRLPGALAKKFDNTVCGGGTAPGDNFDTFNSVTAQAMTAATAYDNLVAADSDISENGGIVTGYALAPQAKSVLLSAKDKNDRPLFINSVADGAIPMILGSPTTTNKGIYVAGSPNTVGIVGDWSQALYGTVAGVNVEIADQATVGTINLWESGMIAVKAEIEIGFRADLSCFNKLTVTA